MAENHIIMERKDLSDDSIVAIPESRYHDRATQVYTPAGVLSGLDNPSFQHHEHWSFDYMQLEAIGRLRSPTDAATAAVAKGLDAICNTQGLRFDGSRLQSDTAIASRILDYEIIEGDIYVVQFKGKRVPDKKSISRSIALFVAPQDGAITVKDNQLFLAGNPTEFPRGDMQYVTQSDMYKGELDAFKAGTLKLHRKSLKPYESRGKYGSPISNGPWIVLEKDITEKHIDLIALNMRRS